MHWAASNGHIETVRLLTNAMKPEDIVKSANGNNGYTALHLAVHSGVSEVAGIILRALSGKPELAALLEAKDVHSQTALNWAVAKYYVMAAKILGNAMFTDPSTTEEEYLEAKYILPGINREEKYTQLHIAAKFNHLEHVKKLLNEEDFFFKGNDLKAKFLAMQDKYGQTALHLATENTDVSSLLINAMTPEAIAKAADGRNGGYTALHIAIHCGNNEVVKQILAKAPETANIRDIYGQTPLHWAGGRINDETIKLLIDAMSPDAILAQSNSGNTALDWLQGKVGGDVIDLLNTKITGRGSIEHQFESYWYEYSNKAMKGMLEVSVASAGIEKVTILSLNYIWSDTDYVAERFINDISAKLDDQIPLLIPLNLYGKHWVGVVIEKSGTVKVNYMDPEQAEIPAFLKEKLTASLHSHYPEHKIELVSTELETQKYNNCGPEVIENFIKYLTGQRNDQDKTAEAHSELYVQQHILEEAWRQGQTKGAIPNNGEQKPMGDVLSAPKDSRHAADTHYHSATDQQAKVEPWYFGAEKVLTNVIGKMLASLVDTLRMAMYVDRHDLSDVLHSPLFADGCSAPREYRPYSPELKDALSQYKVSNISGVPTKQSEISKKTSEVFDNQNELSASLPFSSLLEGIELTRGDVEYWLQQFGKVDLSGEH